jgi:hypothetical protein
VQLLLPRMGRAPRYRALLVLLACTAALVPWAAANDSPLSVAEEVRAFWAIVNPHKLDKIGGILFRYKGREQALLSDLRAKYGDNPEPPDKEVIRQKTAKKGPRFTCVLEACAG